MIQYQILQINITRIVWQTGRRITDEIIGVKGLISFQKNKKCEESKQDEQSKQLLKIKLQIICYLRNKQTRKQNKGEQKTQTNVVQDPG